MHGLQLRTVQETKRAALWVPMQNRQWRRVLWERPQLLLSFDIGVKKLGSFHNSLVAIRDRGISGDYWNSPGAGLHSPATRSPLFLYAFEPPERIDIIRNSKKSLHRL